MSSETRLVIALCRTPLSESARRLALELATAELSWDRVFGVAAAFEVEPVFFSNLGSLRGTGIPDSIIEQSSVRAREARALALARTLVAVQLGNGLEAAGIPVLVLKGPAVGVMGYGDPSLRSYQDIDLLVTPEALPLARDVLLGLGYSQDYLPASETLLIDGDHALEFTGPGSRVELHGALIERHLRFDLGRDELWRDAVTVACAGGEIKVLDGPRLLLFLCAHGTKHEWSRLRWICDVAQVADRLSPEEAARAFAMAEKVHAKKILATGLRLARDVLGQSLDHFPKAAARSDSSTDWIVDHALRQLGIGDTVQRPNWLARIEPGAQSLIFWGRTRERWVDRIICVGRVFFVPTAADGSNGGLAWITRPFRLSLRFARRALGSKAGN